MKYDPKKAVRRQVSEQKPSSVYGLLTNAEELNIIKVQNVAQTIVAP